MYRNIRVLVGPKLPKKAGDICSAKLTFNHKGIGGLFDCGIGLAHHKVVGENPVIPGQWFFNTFTIPNNDTLTSITLPAISFPWPSNLSDDIYDTFKFIQVKGGTKDSDTGVFVLKDTDKDVFVQGVADQFSDLTAVYT